MQPEKKTMRALKIGQSIDQLEKYASQLRPELSANDETFERFSLRPLRITFEVFAGALRKIASVHRKARFNDYGGGLLIAGPTGSGKSSALSYYRSNFPAFDEDEGKIVPVLYVQTPSVPTVKNLAEAILSALGDPASCKGTSEEKTKRIYKFFIDCEVELLLIDEFQHFEEVTRRGATRDVTDWLKNLFNVTRVGVVLAGLPACEKTVAFNPQLARRFSARHHMLGFSYQTLETQLEFRGVLQSIQSEIPIDGICIHDDKFARRMFVATYGLIDYVISILEEVCDIARRTNATKLTLSMFSQAFKDSIWALCPVELDPFADVFQAKRQLDQPGEPFERVGLAQVNIRTKAKR
jgi:Cdc6-like AAA superfamily ATPase